MEFKFKISSSSLREVNRKKCNEWSWDQQFGLVTDCETQSSYWSNFFRWFSLTAISLDLWFPPPFRCLTFTDWAVMSSWHMSRMSQGLDSASRGDVCCLWLQSHSVFKLGLTSCSEKYFSTLNQLHFNGSYCWEFANKTLFRSDFWQL